MQEERKCYRQATTIKHLVCGALLALTIICVGSKDWAGAFASLVLLETVRLVSEVQR